MGYAKYAEDINDQVIENLSDYKFRKETSWHAESRRINKFINEVPDYKMLSVHASHEPSYLKQVRTLYKIQGTLQYRINLSKTLDNLRTTIAKIIVRSYRKNIKRACVMVINKINSYSQLSIGEAVALSEQEKITEKENLVFQIINLLIIALNNAPDEDRMAFIQVLDDIKTVASWFCADDKFLSSLSNISIINNADFCRFLENDLGKEMVTCSSCNQRTVAQCRCCLVCGAKN